jgi:hypothetical protein
MISPHIVRKTTNPTTPPPEAGIHWINVLTNEEFFSVGTSNVDDWIPRSKYNYRSYTVVITQQNLIDGFLLLPMTPIYASEVSVTPIGGITQLNGVDFEVTGNVLSWSGLGLDNFLEENDILIIQH